MISSGRAAKNLPPAASGYHSGVHIKQEFAVTELDVARSIVRSHPFASLVSADLHATHMPCLLDEDADELAVLSHVARADPMAEALSQPMLAIFAGPRGYVSASWYESEIIPTWNHVTLHMRGIPEPFDDALPVLRRTVDHFESVVERPWSLDRLGEEAREKADEVIAFRLRAESWYAERKLSQDKPEDERARVLAGFERPGPYASVALAAAIRDLGAS